MGIRINGSTSGYTELTGPAVGGNSTSGIMLPSGTTAERPAGGSAGQVRFNTTTGQLEFGLQRISLLNGEMLEIHLNLILLLIS